MHDRILLLAFGDLGDTLLTVPALRALRRRYPDAHLTLLTKALPARVIASLGLVDETILVDKHLFDRPAALLSPRAWIALVRLGLRLRSKHAGTVVLFHHLVTRWGTLKYALLALASGAPVRVGIDNGRGWFLTRSVRDEGFGARHEAQYFMDVARLLGADGSLHLEAPITAADRSSAGQILAAHGLAEAPFLVVHPGAGWYGPGRRWPEQNFARACSLIRERTGFIPVLVGTAEDAGATAQVANLLGGRAVDLTGQTSLGELAAILERASLVLANDSGVAHLAATVRAPLVTVFGPSNDRAWRPLSGVVVAADLPCRPCFYRDFERGLPAGCATRECLALVTPEAVAAAAFSLLDLPVAV